MAIKKNVVGTVVPDAEQQQQMDAKLVEIITWLRAWGIILNTEERGSFLKMRIGSEKHVDLVVALSDQHSLNIPAMPLAGMKNDLVVARTAEKLEQNAALIQQLVTDTRIAASGEVWQAFLAYYGVLSSMASRDPDLAKQLAPVTEFMARRRAQPAKATATETAPGQTTEVRP